MNEILNEMVPKPWQKTSYFVLLIAVVVGGAALTFGTSLFLPSLTYLTDEQRAEILKTMFDGWATLSSIVVGGNVVARGGLSLLKQFLQNQLIKNAAGIPDTPGTVNVATTGDVQTAPQSTPVAPPSFPVEGPDEMPASIHQPQNTLPQPPHEVEALFPHDDPTIPRNDEGGEDYESTPG